MVASRRLTGIALYREHCAFSQSSLMIPAFTEQGFLPPGIYQATLDEFKKGSWFSNGRTGGYAFLYSLKNCSTKRHEPGL